MPFSNPKSNPIFSPTLPVLFFDHPQPTQNSRTETAKTQSDSGLAMTKGKRLNQSLLPQLAVTSAYFGSNCASDFGVIVPLGIIFTDAPIGYYIENASWNFLSFESGKQLIKSSQIHPLDLPFTISRNSLHKIGFEQRIR